MRTACCENGRVSFQASRIRGVRVLPARERDVITISLKALPLEPSATMQFSITAEHEVVVSDASMTSIQVVEAKTVQAGSLAVVATCNVNDSSTMLVKVESISSAVQMCQVIDLELEAVSQAVLLGLCDEQSGPLPSVFAAVLGCPRWPEMRCEVRRGFLEVCHGGVDAISDGRASSEPPAAAPKPKAKVYRTVRPPHDEACNSWCRYHFAGACKNGPLCSRCHHRDHYVDRNHAPRRRGHHGRGR